MSRRKLLLLRLFKNSKPILRRLLNIHRMDTNQLTNLRGKMINNYHRDPSMREVLGNIVSIIDDARNCLSY